MMQTFKDAEVRLAETLPGYESRPQQQALAAAVEGAIEDGVHLLAEAGTGTGKSLGYLIPAILSGRRVVISTATKALQDQIADKDVPFLQANLGVPFTFAVLKGRSNYLCGNKAMDVDPGECPPISRILKAMDDNGSEWTGERDGLGFDITDREWMQVAAETDDCQVYSCKDEGVCYANAARQRAQAAQVVVVNHALYLVDLVVKEATEGFASLIGEHDIAIFDESHEVEEYAGKTFGSTFREGGVRGLVTEVRNFARRYAPAHIESLEGFGDALLGSMDALWQVLTPGRIRPATAIEHGDEFVGMANALADLTEAMHAQTLLDECPTDKLEKAKKRRQRLQRRAVNTTGRFHEIITSDWSELVRWVEIDRERPVLRSAPVSAAPYLREYLFAPEHGGPVTILCSATMTSKPGDFTYIAERLGVDTYHSLDVGTPFDYEAQALTYVPAHLPDPSKERAAWSNMMVTEMLDLVKASKGRALLLFTSYKEMRAAYETISPRIPQTCMMQGEAANKALAERFKTDIDSVLFATRSFMTGVDFAGQTLSLVVIDKMPFPVPTEPLTEARCEVIEREGDSAFSRYVVPVMTLTLRQAYGRLIRSATDRGIVAILDPRLKTKGYGKAILRSLPEAPVVGDIAEVERFFTVNASSDEEVVTT